MILTPWFKLLRSWVGKQNRRSRRISHVSRFSREMRRPESLEDRTMLTIQLTFAGLGNGLILDEVGPTGPDNFSVASVGSGLEVTLNGGNFSAGSTAPTANLTYFSSAGFVTTVPANAVRARISPLTATSLGNLTVRPGDGDDDLLISIDGLMIGNVNVDMGPGNNSVTVGGNGLDLTSPGAASLTITSSTIDQAPGSLGVQVNGTSILSNGTALGRIALTSPLNDFGGQVSLLSPNGTVQLTDANALLLGDVNAGNLALNTTGDITQAAGTSVTVSVLTDLSSGPGDITLVQAFNDTAQLRASGGDITFADATGLAVALGDSIAAGTLNLTSTGLQILGNITAGDLVIDANDMDVTQSPGSAITVTGSTTINDTLNANVTLPGANDLHGLGGQLGVNQVVDLLVNDTTDLTLLAAVSGDLVVTAGGGISDAGLTVMGDATLDAGGDIAINSPGSNFFSDLQVDNGANITVRNSGPLNLVDTTVTGFADISSVGSLTVDGSVSSGSSVTLTANDTIAANDNLTFSAGSSVAAATDVSLNAGDSIPTIPASVAISAASGAGMLSIAIDPPGGDADIGTGGVVVLQGTITASTLTMTGGNDGDILDASAAVGLSSSVINGGGGDDSLTGAETPSTISGGSGSDTLLGGEQADSFVGGSGDDLIFAGFGSDTVMAEAGNDVINISYVTGTIQVDAGDDDDSINITDVNTGNVGSVQVVGGNGNDQINSEPLRGASQTLDGGSPAFPSNPGDTLLLDLTNSAIGVATVPPNTTGDGTVSFSNAAFPDIDFISIEALIANDDPNPSYDASGRIGRPASTVELPGDGDSESFSITASGNILTVMVDGQLLDRLPVSSLQSISILGSSDDDRIDVGQTAVDLTFSAGSGTDQFRTFGSGTGDVVYRPDTSDVGTGDVELPDGTQYRVDAADDVQFENFNRLTYRPKSSQNRVSLLPGTGIDSNPALDIASNDGANPVPGRVHLVSVGALTTDLAIADGASPDDILIIENEALRSESAIANLVVLTGAGNDVVEIQDGDLRFASPGTISIDGGTASDEIRVFAQDDASELNIAFTLSAVSDQDATLTTNAGGSDTVISLLNFAGESATLGGNSSTNSFNLRAWNRLGIASIIGGAGTDSLTALDVTGTTNNWSITGVDTGDVGGIAFTEVEILNGGPSASDEFRFGTAGQVTGSIVAGGGTDLLDFSAYQTSVGFSLLGSGVDGFQGVSPAVSNGFTGIDEIIGGGDSGDSISGLDSAANWVLDGFNSYTDVANGRTLAFSSLELLTGGADSDFFSLNGLRAHSISGGDGNDTLLFQSGMSQLIGVFDGGSGTDTYDLRNFNTPRDVSLLSSASEGYVFVESSATGQVSGVDSIVGGQGDDTLRGLSVPSAWAVTGPNAGSYTDTTTSRVLFFGDAASGARGFESLRGGVSFDTFAFANGGTIDGSLDGGGSFDTLIGDNSRSTERFTVDTVNGGTFVSGVTAVIGGRFDSVETITGAAGDDTFVFTNAGSLDGPIDGVGGVDTIVGDNNGNVIEIMSKDAGTIQEKANVLGNALNDFANIENISGGAGSDLITIGALLVGDVRGQSGNDVIKFTDTGAILGSVFGDTGFDALVGDDDGNLFNIIGNTSGVVPLPEVGRGQLATKTDLFRGIETLVGGAGDDTFAFSTLGSVIGVVDGAGGTNSIVGDDDGNVFTVTGPDSGLLSGKLTSFTGIQNLVGGAAADTISVSSSLSGSVTAFGGNDQIIVNAAGSIGGLIDGGRLDDSIEIRGLVTGDVLGSDGDDQIELFNGAVVNGTVSGGNGGDLFLIKGIAQLSNTLHGDAGDDTFEFLSGGSINVMIDGGSGSDRIVGDDDGNVFTITDPDSGSLPDKVPAGYTSIENLSGGAGVDFFNINADLSGSLSGLGGDDQVVVAPGQSVGGDINGDDGNDTFTVGDGSVVVGTIAGGVDNDTLVVDYSGTSTRTLTYDGGSGDDLLRLTGTVAAGATEYSVGPAADQGTVVTAGGGGQQTISFSGLEPIEDLMALASLIINASLGADIINIIDAPTAGRTEVNFNGAFELIRFEGKAAVTVNGGGGNDVINVNNANPANGLSTLSVDGESGNDTVNVLASHTGDLSGGLGDDAFVFADGVQLTGAVDGEGGSDTLNAQSVSASLVFDLTASAASGFAGTESTLLAGAASFSGIDSIRGGAGADGLNGLDVSSTWGLDGTNTYTDDMGRTLAFSDIQTLNGGSDADTFNVTGIRSLTINGGAGGDQLNLATDGSFLSGPFDGDSGTDTVSLAGVSTSQAVTLTANGAVDGFDGTTARISGGFSNVDVLVGGTGSDTITGTDVVSIWTVDGSNTFEDDPANRTLAFSAFENLQGGSLADQFNVSGDQTNNILGGLGDDVISFADLATLTGTINGEGGSDIVDYSAYVSAGVTAMVGDFTSIEQVIGGTTALDSLVGGSGNDSFVVTDMNEGTVNTIDFSGFENLHGRDGNDSFEFQTSGNVSGTVEGGNGTDSLTVSRPGVLTVSLTGPGVDTSNATGNGVAGTEAAIVGGFNNINSLVATGSDILNGANVDSIWSLGTTSSYAVSGQTATFSGFSMLNGGTQADTFNVSASVSFDIDTGDGDDSVSLDAGVTLSGDVQGGLGMDTLSLGTGSTLNGAFDGQAGSDTVTFALSTAPVTVDLLGGSATGFSGAVASVTADFSNVDRLVGSSASGDSLNGLDVDSVWTLDSTNTYSDMTDTVEFDSFETLNGGVQDDTFNLLTSVTANLNGNNGDDTFSFQDDAASLIGSISGGSGNNSLSFAGLSAQAANVTLTGNGGDGFSGTAGPQISAGFSEIFTLTGGGAVNDTLTGQNVSSTWEVNPVGDTYRDDSTGRMLDFGAFENLTGGSLDDSFTIDALATLGGSISDLGGGDVVTVESNGLGMGGSVLGGISTGDEGDIVRIEDDATVAGVIDTGSGNDIVEIAYDGGTTRTLNLAAGAGTDEIQLDGGDAAATIDYTVGPAADQGTLVTNIGADAQTVVFSGLTPTQNELLVDRQDGAAITINGSSSADVITVQDGLPDILFFTEVDFNNAFAPIQFQNKTRAFINGLGNADTINLDNPNRPVGPLSLDFVNVDGGAGNDTINVLVDHTGDLNGGSGNDRFSFTDGVTVAGEMADAVNGGSGTDTIDVSTFSTDTLVTLTSNSGVGFTGDLPAVIIGGPFTGIDNILAGSGMNDSLTGLDTTASWQVDGSNTYTDTASFRSLSFGNFEELIGHSQDDTFEISGVQSINLDGRGGDDQFQFATDDAAVTGFVLGDAGIDTLDFSAFSSGAVVTVALTGEGISGFDGDVSQIAGSFTDIDNILAGDSSSDSLTGIDAVGAWTVDNPGNYLANGQSLDFSDFENLNGNNSADIFLIQDGSINLSGADGDDTFNVQDGVTLTGMIDGGDHTTGDSLSFAASSSSVVFDVSLVTNVENVTGSGTGDDTLQGTDGNDAFQIDGMDSGTVNGVSFTDFANLDGGLGNDTFDFTLDAGILAGSIEGGSGSDTLGFSGVTGNVTVDLSGAGGIDGFNGTETGGTFNGFLNIDVLEGGMGAGDTLTGLDLDSTWTIGATNTYAAAGSSIEFELNTADRAFENLVGQSRDDVFNVSGTQAVSIDSGDGADEVNLASAAMLTGMVATGADDDLVTFGTGAVITGTLDAGADNDLLDFSASSTDVDVTLTMANGAGGFDATAVALVTGSLTGIEEISGGSGSNSLTGIDSDSTWTIGGTNTYEEDADPTNVLTFSGIGAAIGGSMVDSFDVNLSTSLDLSGGAGADTFDVVGTANVTGSLNGDAGDDVFTFSGAAIVPASLDGGADSDTVDFSASISAVSINLDTFTNVETVNGTSISDTIVGSSGDDDFTVTGAIDSGTVLSGGVTTAFVDFENLQGGSGNDSFAIADTLGLTGAIDGGADSDTLDYSAWTTDVSVNLATGSATNIGGTVSGIENATGGSGNDMLTGDAGNNVLTGNGGNDVLADGAGDDMLDGGTEDDTYLLTPGSSDILNDVSGTETLDFSNASAGVTIDLDSTMPQDVFGGNLVTLNSGTFENFAGSGFGDTVSAAVLTGINRDLAGGGGSDTFATSDSTATNRWDITDDDAGTFGVGGVDVVNFSSFENLVGGTDADSFVFEDGDSITGTIDGGMGTDTLDYTAYTAGNSVSLNLANVVSIETALGGAGSDTITADSVPTAYNVTALDTGDVAGLNFTSFESLTGGSADDSFTFGIDGALTGGVDGAGGTTNTLTLSTDNDSVSLSFLSPTTGFSGNVLNESAAALTSFANINSIDGGTGGADQLTGLDATSSWTLNDAAADLYQSGGRSTLIDGFETYNGGVSPDSFSINGIQTVDLNAGAGTDLFAFASGASHTGTIDGGSEVDILDFVNGAPAEAIALSAVATDGFTGVVTGTINLFQDIDVIDGTGTDSLAALVNTAATVNLNTLGNTLQSGGQSLSFSGVTSVTGSTMDDIFNVTGVHAVNVDAGAGNDQIILQTDGSNLTAVIDGGANTDTFDLSLLTVGRVIDSADLMNIENLLGTGGNDTLIGNAAGSAFHVTGASNAGTLDVSLAFSGVETLMGGAGVDTFTIDDLLTIGAVVGEGGDDTLSLAAYATASSVQLSGVSGTDGFSGSETAVGSFAGVNMIIASTGAAGEITGLNADATFTLDGTTTATYATGGQTLNATGFSVFSGNAGADRFDVTGNQTATANGGGGNDTIAIADTVVFDGVFSGGAGSDTIDLSAYATAQSFALSGTGTTDGFLVDVAPLTSSADDIDGIVGGGGVDTVTGLNADASWTVGATDTYTSTNSLTASGVEIRQGGSGVDVFEIQANALTADSHQIMGLAGNDIFNLNFAAGTGLATGASLAVLGGDPAADAANPDTVNLNVDDNADGARSISLAYQSTTTGDLAVTLDGTSMVTLTQVEAFNLTGDSANDDSVTVIGTVNPDSVTVTPTASGATLLHNGGVAGGDDGPDISISGASQSGLTINGGGSTSDALLYNGAGTVTLTGPSAGTITQSGVADVNFLSIENLSTSQPSAYVVDAQGDADDSMADEFLVELNAGGSVEVSVNGGLLLREDPNNINGLFIIGSGDDDTLTVDFTSGDPIPTNVLFNGEGGTDDLVSNGGTTGVYAPSASIPGNGTLTVDGSVITFSGLEPVSVMNMTDLTFVSQGDADVISVTSPAVGQNLVTGTSGGVAFESLQFSGVANFTLDAASQSSGGADSIVIGDVSGIGLTSFTINTGTGADSVDASAVTAVDLTISTGDGDDVITGGAGNDVIDGGLGSDGITQTVDGFQGLSDASAAGAGTDSLTSIERATLNGGAGDDTIGATAFTGDLTVSTGNGDNLVNSGSGNDLVIGGLGSDTLNGGGGADTLFGSGGKDSLNGGLGDDVLKGQGATGDSLEGGAGNDFIDGGSGVDFVVATSTGNITLTNTQLFADGIDNLTRIERAILTAGDGNDVIDATAFSVSLGTFLYGGLGNDTILGAEARDVVFGLEGDDLLIGNGGNDDLMGSSGRDTMIGGAGEDRLRGQGGSGDILIGGLGDDTLDGGAGNDRLIENGDVDFVLTDGTLTGLGTDTIIDTEFATLNGGSGDNTIDASGTVTLAAVLNGLGGNDTITGGPLADLINGGEGSDIINAGDGDDTINGGSGHDMIDGEGGNDRLVVSANANLTTTDSQTTGDGTDTFTGIELVELTGGDGDNLLDASGATLPTIQNGGKGNDTLVTGSGTDVLDGGDGIDVSSITGTNVLLTDVSFNGTDTISNIEIVNITAGATDSRLDASGYTLGSVNLIGGPGNDTLLGGSGNDTLAGNEGNDSLVGGDGNDIATGGIGNDVIQGGKGNDNLNGNGGNDLLSGEEDNDLARGGTGNDTILGGAGSDTLNGEDGNDSIRGGAADDTIDGGRNNDTIFGDEGNDSMVGGLGEDGISGGLGNDYALGDFGNDTLIGGAGNDNLLGSAGDDVVLGGDDDDLVRGNGGNDTLAGNAGMDTIVGSSSEIDESFSEANYPFLL